jgi:hypothetical protein
MRHHPCALQYDLVISRRNIRRLKINKKIQNTMCKKDEEQTWILRTPVEDSNAVSKAAQDPMRGEFR